MEQEDTPAPAGLSMLPEESMALANQIFADAGWRPIDKPCWAGGFTMARQVGGVSPDGGTQYVKGLDIVRPDDPAYGPDTPDEHHEAAAWLVAHHAARFPNPLTTDAALVPPTIEALNEAPVPESEAPGEAAEEPQGALGSGDDAASVEGADDLGSAEAGPPGGGGELLHDDGQDGAGDRDHDYALDADFIEAGDEPEIEGADLGGELLEDLSEEPAPLSPEPLAQQPEQSRFYGLDDLDRRRSLRIGDVQRFAIERAPVLTAEQSDRLRYLRSYVAGVAEETVTRASNDSELRDELDALESVLSHEIAWDTVLKTKVRFLNDASREDIEAFVVEDGWP